MRPRPAEASAVAVWLVALAAVLTPIAVRAQATRLEAVSLAKPSVVVVLGVDIAGGELVPVATGSGTVVSADGAVLTNHHVLSDQRGDRLHDLFVIGLYRADDRAPELVCAGLPGQGLLRPELDLALIRCDRDLDGRDWWPENWPAVPVGDSTGIVPGEQVWVLGYPNASGGTIGVSAGLVSGWTGEQGGAASRAFMRTDATISGGNSGGTAVDRDGQLIGVPTAFQMVSADNGERVTAVGRVGLIRPIEHARELVDAARAGVPGVLPGADATVLVSGRVVEAGSLRPVRGAVVLATPAGTTAHDLDAAHLADVVLAWGTVDATGSYTLTPPLPVGARYSVAVAHAGYRAAVEPDALDIPVDTRHPLLPWRTIELVPDSVP